MATAQEDKAKLERYENTDANKKVERKAWKMRMTEAGTFAGASLATGFILDRFPEYSSFGPGGYLSPQVIMTGAGLALFLAPGRKKNSSLREVGSGLIYAGAAQLLQSGGAKINQAIAAP